VQTPARDPLSSSKGKKNDNLKNTMQATTGAVAPTTSWKQTRLKSSHRANDLYPPSFPTNLQFPSPDEQIPQGITHPSIANSKIFQEYTVRTPFPRITAEPAACSHLSAGESRQKRGGHVLPGSARRSLLCLSATVAQALDPNRRNMSGGCRRVAEPGHARLLGIIPPAAVFPGGVQVPTACAVEPVPSAVAAGLEQHLPLRQGVRDSGRLDYTCHGGGKGGRFWSGVEDSG